MYDLMKHILSEKDIFQPASKEDIAARDEERGERWYSIRVVRAHHRREAIQKVEDNEFDENDDICDAVLPARLVTIKGYDIQS